MSVHEYSQEKALKILLEKVKERGKLLAARIQASIDAGKDTTLTQEAADRRQKPRTYRKTVPYTHEEALGVAVDVLQACFIDLTLCINSTSADFEEAAVGIPKRKPGSTVLGKEEKMLETEAKGKTKLLEIEGKTETQIALEDVHPFRIELTDEKLIDEQKDNLIRLQELTTFNEDVSHGYLE